MTQFIPNVNKITQIKKSKEAALTRRNKSKDRHNLSVQHQYYNRYLNDEQTAKENEEKIQELERLENELLDKLQLTMNKQLDMHKTLEGLVKHGKME